MKHKIENVEVKVLICHDAPGPIVKIDVGLSADIVELGLSMKEYEADRKIRWFTVYLQGLLRDGLVDVEVHDVKEFHNGKFEKESALDHTLDAKGEVLMTIMAALAQQESESLSVNVRLGIQFRNQQGKVQINHNWFLGYTKDEDGKLIIVPEEVAIVRRIYAEYMDGASFLQIKRSLEADGVLNVAGREKWHESNIKQILTNEKYIGDALLQKTYTVNTLEKKRINNNGIAPKYYVEGSHEAIIDKDVFLRVQAEIARRANIMTDGKKRIYSVRYALSSIVFCGHCGDIFRRIKWNNRGCKSTVWRCVSRVLKKSSGIDCPARTIHEEVL